MERNHPVVKSCGNVDENVDKERLDNMSKKKLRLPENCCIVCEQNFDDIVVYKRHPDDSENEIITLTCSSVTITGDNEDCKEKRLYKLTDFSVYDKYKHLCRFDDGLVEKGKTLLASGYVKKVYDDDPSMNNGIPTHNIGPLNEWSVVGFGEGEKAFVTFSSEFAEYYLLEPSLEYQPIMKEIEKKKNLIKLVIDFLLVNVWKSPTYEELLQWFKIDGEVTEDTLLDNAQFVCNQVMSYDAAGTSNDDIFITTPCIRTLAEKAGVILKHKYTRKFDTTFKLPWSKATTTDLVSDVFDTSKFGEAGCSKQVYPMCRCSKLSTQDGNDSNNVRWVGEQIATHDGCTYYNVAQVDTVRVELLNYVMLKSSKPNKPVIAQVVYMWEKDGEQMFHARFFCHGKETVLGETSNPQELFKVDKCENCLLSSIVCTVEVERKRFPNDWALQGGIDKLQPHLEDNGNGFFCSKFYNSKSSRFEDIIEEKESANRSQYASCSDCSNRSNKAELEVPVFRDRSIHWLGDTYNEGTAVFLDPFTITNIKGNICNDHFMKKEAVNNTLFPEYYRKSAEEQKDTPLTNFYPFDIGIIENILITSQKNIWISVRKFYRPEETQGGAFLSYEQDLNLLYWSVETSTVSFKRVKGKCYLAYGDGLGISPREWTKQGPYRFYFTKGYDKNMESKYFEVPDTEKQIGTIPKETTKGRIQTRSEKAKVVYQVPPEWEQTDKPLRCMDVFGGCGGLSEGLRQSAVAEIKWAIDNEPNAAHAFKLNHPDSIVYTADCNELLSKAMANEEWYGRKLPQKGEVEMIVGGPPCQGFSGMNRFSNGLDSSFKNSLIASYLSYCDYYRPHYIIMENVRNFAAYKHNLILKLTVSCFLAIGYQVTFGVLQAGNYGIPQSRHRLIIMAAAPGYPLPKFPEPQNTFKKTACQLTVMVGNTKYYTGAKWWESAPYRTLTVRDAIADLPDIESGSDCVEMPYDCEAISHFQKMVRASDSTTVTDHICKETTPLVQSRINHIPLSPKSDWRDLPNIVVELSDGTSTATLKYNYRSIKQKKGPFRGVCKCFTGKGCNPDDHQVNTLIPWCLPHSADRHNNWAGLYGRLNWDGYFYTTVTNPEPMGKQGRVLHPDQNRIVSVRECARSQGFPDHYQFYGSIMNKHRQIGNAVPPPLGVALGREIQKSLSLAENNRL